MARVIAMFNSVPLPDQFHYEPATPVKRQTIIPTASAVVKQIATAIIDQDTLISWSCEACSQAEWQQFFDWFNVDADTTYPFTGYWEDSFTVKFHALDPPQVQSKLFNCSGSFQIVTVTAWHG